MVELQDFVINEGLRRWDVRYYLAAVQSDPDGGFALKVAFEVRITLMIRYAPS